MICLRKMCTPSGVLPLSSSLENNNISKYGKADKAENVEIAMISENSSKDEETKDRGLCLEFLKILVTYGKFSSVFSYSIESYTGADGKLKYYVRRTRVGGMFRSAIFALMILHLSIFVINFNFNISYSKLVNSVKRTACGLFALKLVIVFYSLEHVGRRKGLWIQILEQADHIQESFVKFDIKLPSKWKIKVIGRLICIIFFTLCFVHILVFAVGEGECGPAWYERGARNAIATLTFNIGNFNVSELHPTVAKSLGTTGVILDIVSWNTWYLIDALRVFSSLIVWIVFRTINSALESGKLNLENLPDIMEMHFNGTKLMNLFNELLAPITLASTIFNIVFICFWTNYVLIAFEFKISYIIGVMCVVRMIAVFFITADVNTEAYKISTWLENNFSGLDGLPKMDKTKLKLFTSVIYNRDVIGFKGKQFFTVTPALNAAIAGLVLTYTVIGNQVINQ